MNTTVSVAWSPTFLAGGIICPIAFFPASAVGDEIGNYAIASAGTIVNKDASDDPGNTNTATESVCPKGWTLPTTKQTSAIGPSSGSSTYITGFNPVLGGSYGNGTLSYEDTNGLWWASVSQNGTRRYYLNYNVSGLYTNYGRRYTGVYVRCVSEEKTVTDLTYLQDMTGEIANNML